VIRYTLRFVGTLVALQLVFGGLVFLLSDLVWLALPATILFLGLVWVAGRTFVQGPSELRRPLGALSRVNARPSLTGAIVTALIWQLPGLQGSLRFLTDTRGWTAYDGITDLQDFAMETWHTALLPILTAVPVGLGDGYYARYYILLVAASPALVASFVIAAATARRW
jgi:hypothetical protein